MIIDYEDNLRLSDKDVEWYQNQLVSLECLATGLDFLGRQVQKVEAILVDELEKAGELGKNKRVGFHINIPGLNRATRDLVTCAFHWYSVTACNYVRLVGWLATRGDSKKAIAYVERVIPCVKTWRDKVGAHFALVSPNEKDTPADLAGSVIPHLSFEDNTFYVGSLTLNIASEDRGSSSSARMRWSLTQTHKRLTSRYWGSAAPAPEGPPWT